MALSSEIDRELATLRSQADELVASLDALMPACRQELVEAAAKWINTEVAREVSEHAREVTVMGPEKAKAAKAQVADLIGRLPKLVAEATGDPATWPHRGARQEARDREAHFSAVFRAIISNLGPILDSAGFLAGEHRDYPTWQRSGAGFRYSINPGFDSRNHPSIRQYEGLHAQHLSIRKQIAEKTAELEKAKAKELWDSA